MPFAYLKALKQTSLHKECVLSFANIWTSTDFLLAHTVHVSMIVSGGKFEFIRSYLSAQVCEQNSYNKIKIDI